MQAPFHPIAAFLARHTAARKLEIILALLQAKFAAREDSRVE